MHFTLRVASFPKTIVLGILKKSLPSTTGLARAYFSKVMTRQPLNAFTGFITTKLSALLDPPANEFSFLRLNLHMIVKLNQLDAFLNPGLA